PYLLNIDDQFTNATNEKVGRLQLVCTLATFSATPDTLDPNPQTGADGQEPGDHLTCYELLSHAQATPSVVTLKDAFGEQTVTVKGSSKYVCVVARKECVSGCPVITQ